MPDDQIRLTHTTTENLKEIIPPVLMVLGGLSLLRTSRLLGFVALGAYLYDAAVNSDNNRKLRGRDHDSKKTASAALDQELEDSFPASDPPSFSGSTAGAP